MYANGVICKKIDTVSGNGYSPDTANYINPEILQMMSNRNCFERYGQVAPSPNI